MHYYFALLGFTFPDILYLICTQTTQQEPGNPHKCWISELHFLFKLNSDIYMLWFVTSLMQGFYMFYLLILAIFWVCRVFSYILLTSNRHFSVWFSGMLRGFYVLNQAASYSFSQFWRNCISYVTGSLGNGHLLFVFEESIGIRECLETCGLSRRNCSVLDRMTGWELPHLVECCVLPWLRRSADPKETGAPGGKEFRY